MITSRDIDVIEFVREFKVADTDMITALFFPDKRTAQRRLKVMVDAKKIYRIRDSTTSNYIYFHKQPRQLKHSLAVVQFYTRLSKIVNVKKFSVEPTYGDIRPDAAFVYEANGKTKVGLLEVELSNKGFDSHKYQRFFANDNYKQFMTAKPYIYVITDKAGYGSDMVYIKKDFSNFVIL